MQQLLHLVKRVAASSSAGLLRGESGTGKELLARELHENSPRAQQPFIKDTINHPTWIALNTIRSSEAISGDSY